MKLQALTGMDLLKKLSELSEEELNLPIQIFDNSSNTLKDINNIVSLDRKILLTYSLS